MTDLKRFKPSPNGCASVHRQRGARCRLVRRATERRAISASTAQRIRRTSIMVNILRIALVRDIRPQANCPDGWGNHQSLHPRAKMRSASYLLEETIAAWVMAVSGGVFEKFRSSGDGPTDAVMVDNAGGLAGRTFQISPFPCYRWPVFSVNGMLGFESVKLRLENGNSRHV